MLHQEKNTLTWHNYSDHLRDTLKEMITSHEFADVTLGMKLVQMFSLASSTNISKQISQEEEGDQKVLQDQKWYQTEDSKLKCQDCEGIFKSQAA